MRFGKAKEVSRENNLLHVMNSYLLFSGGKMRVDWLEVPGEGSPMVRILRSYLVPGVSKLVCLDRNAEYVREGEEQYGSEICEWVLADDLFAELANSPDKYANVGVLNVDLYNSLRLLEFPEQMRIVMEFATRQFWAIGAFMVFLNYSMRGSVREEFAQDVIKTLEPYLDLSQVDLTDEGYLYKGGTPDQPGNRRLNLRIHLGPTRTPNNE